MAFNLFPKSQGKDKPVPATPAEPRPVSSSGNRHVSAREVAASAKARPAAAMPKGAAGATPEIAREPEPTGPPSMIEWTLGLQQKIHVVEPNPGLCAVLENAALLHANGQSVQAREILEDGIVNDPEAKVSALAWLSLFDLMQRAGDRTAFDKLAMQYVVAFERSAPGWEEGGARSRPDAKPAAGAYVGLTGKLSAAHAPQISNLLTAAHKQPQLRMDLGSLTGADEAGAQLLASALAQLRKRQYALQLQHPEKLQRALEISVTQGRGAGEGYWTLLLELLQWVNDHAGFEDRAVEYAVAFEVSPPSWEPPVHLPSARSAPLQPEAPPPVAAAPDNSDTLVWQGAIVGSSDPQIAKFAALREGRNAVPIDMTAVDRVDFVGAGALFNAISRAEGQRRIVQIIGATPIVRALLLLIGISPRHFIKKAE